MGKSEERPLVTFVPGGNGCVEGMGDAKVNPGHWPLAQQRNKTPEPPITADPDGVSVCFWFINITTTIIHDM